MEGRTCSDQTQNSICVVPKMMACLSASLRMININDHPASPKNLCSMGTTIQLVVKPVFVSLFWKAALLYFCLSSQLPHHRRLSFVEGDLAIPPSVCLSGDSAKYRCRLWKNPACSASSTIQSRTHLTRYSGVVAAHSRFRVVAQPARWH